MTVQANLDSPRGPKLRRKKSADPTMTLHTKAATDEVYELFNQPIDEPEESSDDDESDESDEDGYTTGGESTGTGRISAGVSEYGDETQGEIDDDKSEPGMTTEVEATQDDTAWSEFTTSKHMPKEGETNDDTGLDLAREEAHNSVDETVLLVMGTESKMSHTSRVRTS